MPVIGLIIALAIAWGVGFLHGEEQNNASTSYRYQETAKEAANRECVGTEPTRVFECVTEKAEAAQTAAHDRQDLKAQQEAAWAAMLGSVWSFGALIATALGLIWVKGTLDATREVVRDTKLGATATATAANASIAANQLALAQFKINLRPRLYASTDGPFVCDSHFAKHRLFMPPAYPEGISKVVRLGFMVKIKNFSEVPATITKVIITTDGYSKPHDAFAIIGKSDEFCVDLTYGSRLGRESDIEIPQALHVDWNNVEDFRYGKRGIVQISIFYIDPLGTEYQLSAAFVGRRHDYNKAERFGGHALNFDLEVNRQV